MTPSCSQRPARRTTGRESSLLPADSTIPSAASSYLNDVTTSSPAVSIQAPCIYRKIATRLKRDGAESLGFCRRVADDANTAHHQGKDSGASPTGDPGTELRAASLFSN